MLPNHDGTAGGNPMIVTPMTPETALNVAKAMLPEVKADYPGWECPAGAVTPAEVAVSALMYAGMTRAAATAAMAPVTAAYPVLKAA